MIKCEIYGGKGYVKVWEINMHNTLVIIMTVENSFCCFIVLWKP